MTVWTRQAQQEDYDAVYKSVLLVGHPAYYPRFGYRPAETFGIVSAMALPADVFMVCELTDGGLDGVRGCVEFAPEFHLE